MHLLQPDITTPGAFSSRMSISARLGAMAVTACGLILALTCLLLWHQWRVYLAAEEVLASVETFRLTLVAMEKVSAERGSTISALGEDLPIPEARRTALANARNESELAVERLFTQLGAQVYRPYTTERTAVRQAKGELLLARANADRLLELPRQDRTQQALDETIGELIDIIRRFVPIADTVGLTIAQSNPNALDALQMARIAAMLREQAGLLGSRFTAALEANRQLTESEQRTIERTLGRIDQLRVFIDSQVSDISGVPRPTLLRMQQYYFGDGLRYVAAMRTLASRPQGPDLSTQQFGQQYIPLMRPIIEFRDEMTDLVRIESKRQRDAARLSLIETSGIALALISSLFFLVWLFRQRVIRPFTEATQSIVAIAAGNLETDVSSRAYRGEIRALFDAVRTLRATSLDRKQARDYARLIQRAILPDSLMQTCLGEHHSVLWKPRDVVGGDFYIYRPSDGDNDSLIGVIDCAGHSVPGALMTMLAFATIDQAIDRTQGRDPATILHSTDRAMRGMLGRDQFNQALATSMEVGLVRIDRERRCLSFAGARISLFASDGDEVREYKGDRRAIGDKHQGQYHDIDVPLQAGWTFYLCTDGFLDQSGGEDGFGFGAERFSDMLRKQARLPLKEQAVNFAAALEAYQGDYPQRDDITILSFRLD
jgi:serine phosphatase RsbU (regulator of sigma subunit)